MTVMRRVAVLFSVTLLAVLLAADMPQRPEAPPADDAGSGAATDAPAVPEGLEPVTHAYIMEDPWTLACLQLGYKVYAERAEADGKEVLDGEYRAYGPGGVLVVKGTYANGLPEGEFRYWYESGQPSGWCTYSLGREVGASLSLHENGRPMRICYRNDDGKRDGPEAYWDAEGHLQATLEWEDGHVRLLTLYEEGAPTETLAGDAAQERTLEMMRQARAKSRQQSAVTNKQ